MLSDIEEATIAELQAAMEARRLSSRILVRTYLHRIEKLDPQLKSIIEVNPDALAFEQATKVRKPPQLPPTIDAD